MDGASRKFLQDGDAGPSVMWAVAMGSFAASFEGMRRASRHSRGLEVRPLGLGFWVQGSP